MTHGDPRYARINALWASAPKPHYRLHYSANGLWWMEQISPTPQTFRWYSEARWAIWRAGYSFWKSPLRDEFRDSLATK